MILTHLLYDFHWETLKFLGSRSSQEEKYEIEIFLDPVDPAPDDVMNM